MNPFKALYANQYNELKAKSKEATAKKNGDILLTLALLFNFFSIMFFLVVAVPDFGDAMEDLIEDIFGRRMGRSLGKILAIIPMAIIYGIVRFTIGRDKSYQNIIEEFEALSEEQQKLISKKGLTYFIASIAVFVVTMLLLLLI